MTSRAAAAHARVAGTLLLLMGFAAGLSLVYVPGKVIVAGDAQATAANVVELESLVRTAVAGHLVILFFDIAVAVLLYWLLRPVNATVSMLAAMFRLAMATMRGATVVTHLVALQLLGSAGYLQAIPAEQRHALALQSFDAFDGALHIDLTFFAVHLLLLGWLVYKAQFIPRILGVLLAIGGAGYMIEGLAWFLAPGSGLVLSTYVGWGELFFALWLVIRGVRVSEWDRRQGLAAAA